MDSLDVILVLNRLQIGSYEQSYMIHLFEYAK